MQPAESITPRVAEIAAYLRRDWNRRPRVGIVLGTGAAAIANAIDCEARWAYRDIPHFPSTTAVGHVGALIGGQWECAPVVAMQGRFHYYEGHSRRTAALGIHVMRALGIEYLVLTNAAGGVNPSFAVGDLMAIDSYVDLFFRAGETEAGIEDIPWRRPWVRADYACEPGLLEAARRAGVATGVAMRRGVYFGLLGPTYETRAEYRMIRRLGGDAVGMSTIPELEAASRLGIPTLAISIITNIARPDGLGQTTGAEVVAAGQRAAASLQCILAAVIRGSAAA
jgi:purine-nucleoside phosphorylase